MAEKTKFFICNKDRQILRYRLGGTPYYTYSPTEAEGHDTQSEAELSLRALGLRNHHVEPHAVES